MERGHRGTRTWWMLAGLLGIAGFFLFTEHRAHLFGVLPYLFLFPCPLLHIAAFIAIMLGFLLQWPTLRAVRRPDAGLRAAARTPDRGRTTLTLSRRDPMRPDRTELDPRAFGFAAGTVAAAVCALCALYVAATPGAMPMAFGYPMHSGVAGGTHPMAWGGFIGGLLLMSVVVGLAFAATAALYNRFLRGFRAVAPTDVPVQRRA